MPNIKYRETLINAIEQLVDINGQVKALGINILMKSELEEIDELFEEGDVYDVKYNHLASAQDVNVKIVADIVKNINRNISSLININNIKDNEVSFDI